MSQTVPNVAGSQGQWQTIELRNLEFKKKSMAETDVVE